MNKRNGERDTVNDTGAAKEQGAERKRRNDAPNQRDQPFGPLTAVDDLTVDLNDLTRVVGRSLGRDDLSVQGWGVDPLRYTVRNAISAGLYRIHGVASVETHKTAGLRPARGDPGAIKPQQETRPLEKSFAWSLILKVVQPLGGGPADDLGHWNYWQREALAYRSGLLERLIAERDPDPASLAVPRCWEVREKPNGHLWLWMEDVIEAGGGRWTLDRYGLAARHFGSFQGGFLIGRPLPSDPWLSRGWMRARVASFADAMRRLHDPALWDQPLVRRTCPRALEGRLAQLWDERDQFLDALDRLPQTLCHLDVWRPNLLSRVGPNGDQTVALDWSYVGIGAVGQDIGNLVPDSLGNFDIGIDQAAAMDRAVFEGYLQGLREQGWAGDARQVRLGYTAAAALGWGLGTPWWLVWPEDAERQAEIEHHWGRPLEELLAQRALLTGFVLDLAEEAQTLIAQGAI